MSKYSLESTIGEILDSPECVAIIKELCPKILEHPQKDRVRNLPASICVPFNKGLFTDEQLEEFKRRIAEIK